VQIGNHTYAHKNLTTLSSAQIRAEVERNEEWIATTFGTTSRPYLRPPYGFYNNAVIEACAAAGFPKILMWDGSFGDSAVLTQDVLLEQARKYLEPGTIMLGHANHPTVTHVYDQIVELIEARELSPVTLDEMFGTKRAAVGA
jgi:peptidoglycan/xylan/chitin deacetylase (PgdA/CDA1 family)